MRNYAPIGCGNEGPETTAQSQISVKQAESLVMKGSSVRFRPADFSVQDAECVSTSRPLVVVFGASEDQEGWSAYANA
jgi:hypothetical protein